MLHTIDAMRLAARHSFQFQVACRLVVVAIETGGRWSDEAAELLRQLALAKAREAPALLAHSAALAWERRWTRMLGMTCAIAFPESLVAPNESDTWCQTGGVTPSLAELLTHNPRYWVGLDGS